MMLNIFKANARIKELEAKLAEYEKAAPGAFEDKDELVAEVQELKEKLADVVDHTEELVAFKADNTKLLETVDKLTLKMDEQEAAATTLTTGYVEKESALNKHISELTTQLTEAKESANRVAATTLASLGIQEGTVKESAIVTPEDIVTQWTNLTGQEKDAFYQNNRMAILKQLGLIK